MNLTSAAFVVNALLLSLGTGAQATAQSLITFQNGKVADADAVNSNFTLVNNTANDAVTMFRSLMLVPNLAGALGLNGINTHTDLNNLVALEVFPPPAATDPRYQHALIAATTTAPYGSTAGFQVETRGPEPQRERQHWGIGSGASDLGGVGALGFRFSNQSTAQNGVTAMVIRAPSQAGIQVGIGTADPHCTLDIAGTACNDLGVWSSRSDLRLKKNVTTLHGTLDQLLALRGVHFEYKDPATLHALPGRRTGFIAQEVERVFPDWVAQGKDGYKMVATHGFEALTVEALREIDAKNRALAAANQALQADHAILHERLDGMSRELVALRAALRPLLSRHR